MLAFMLLYPFRSTVDPTGKTWREDWQKYPLGAAVPVVGPTREAAGVSLDLDGRKDEWSFRIGADGRSHIALQRGGDGWELK